MATPREFHQRKQDVLDKLENERDVWAASGDDKGRAHLVPLALGWDGETIILATETRSRTVQNVMRSKQLRLALGNTRDVVMIDTTVRLVSAEKVEARFADLFAERKGWDPRKEDGAWTYLLVTPVRIQAWRDVAELSGRTVMRDGAWIQ